MYSNVRVLCLCRVCVCCLCYVYALPQLLLVQHIDTVALSFSPSGLFSSIPFWHLEKYDDRSGAAAPTSAAAAAAPSRLAAAGSGWRRHPELLEHCGDFRTFINALEQSIRSGVAVLADTGAWVLIHWSGCDCTLSVVFHLCSM